MNADRLAQAASFGCEVADLSKGDSLVDIVADILGEPEVDAAVDAVGFEARGHGKDAAEAPATVLNDIMNVSRAGASLGIPGLYVTGDPGAVDDAAKVGQIGVRLGLGWAKSHTFVTGQCPVKQYNRQLMNLILADKAHIAKAVNATTISLDDAAQGYAAFDKGAAQKFVIDPHGMVRA
jgi:glutathione-independent formaldehyde dehydrogenase